MIEYVADLRQSRHNFLISMGASGALLSGCVSRVTPVLGQGGVDPRVEQIVADTIAVDMHNHVAQLNFARTAADAKPDPGGDLAGMKPRLCLPGPARTRILSSPPLR
jgi:hypothetical protein